MLLPQTLRRHRLFLRRRQDLQGANTLRCGPLGPTLN